MTLKVRFSLIFIGFILLTLSIYSAAYFLLERRAALTQQSRYAFGTLDKLASSCREASLAGNWIGAINQIKTVQKDPEVAYAACLDAQGRALAHSQPERIGTLVKRADEVASLHKPETTIPAEGNQPILEVSAPIILAAGPPGAAVLGYDAQALRVQIESRLWTTLRQMAVVSTFTLAVGLLAALLIARSLSLPIQQLATATQEVARGRLGYQNPPTGRSDELGQLSESFNAMSRRLLEFDEMKQQFVSGITHDLKNPLTGIKAGLQLLLKNTKSFEPRQIGQLQAALRSSDRMQAYILNILDYSRIQYGELPMNRTRFFVGELAQSVAQSFAPQSEMSGVRIEARTQEGLPQVDADYELIHRVINNLVTNAFKYTSQGGAVTIHVQRHDPGFLRVSVQDTGVGIPADAVEKVFEKFYQVKETIGMARGSGTGLGLTISKQTVEQHGGRIWVESVYGKGTTFHFTLPAAGPA